MYGTLSPCLSGKMDGSQPSTSRGPPPHQPPATPAVRRRSPTIVSTPNAIAMIIASGDEYSDDEEKIDEVAVDVSTSFFMLNLEIIVSIPRKHSENVFYIISADIM